MHEAALYDTSVVIDVEDVELGVYGDAAVTVSAVTIGELAYGVGAGDRVARELRLRRVLVRIAGRNLRPRRLDLQIAATAAAARIPLLTMNPDGFVGVAPLVDVVPIRRAS